MEKFFKDLLKKVKLNEPTISTILGAIVIFIVGVLILNYFKTGNSEQSQEIGLENVEEIQVEGDQEISFDEQEGVYKVQENDSLWKISEKYYQDGYKWAEIAQVNSLVNPDYLEVGQELKLPKPELKEAEEKSEETKVEEDQTETTEEVKTITEDKYVVKEGDYLWQICISAYGDGYKWTEVSQANNLIYPDYLEVGQELKLPR